jgi:hypothetical protein
MLRVHKDLEDTIAVSLSWKNRLLDEYCRKTGRERKR